MNELVSVIMPSYNTARFIGNSIKSVLNQTYTNWELIIVDDCSTDNTDEVVENFKDERIKFFKNKKNYGAAFSRNRALKLAEGRWIAFLDSDDLWVHTKLEKQISFMKENGYSFTYTDYMIQLNGKWLPYIYISPNKIDKKKMYDYCYFATLTVIYDRKAVGLIQIENLRKNNDYAMWLQAVEKVDCYRYPKCLGYYIKHEGSISSVNKLKLIKWHYILFKVGLKKNMVASIILTLNNIFCGVIKKLRYKVRTNKMPNLNTTGLGYEIDGC